MPSRVMTKRRPRRRRRRKRYARVHRPILSGFPQSKLVKLRYVETNVNLNPTAATVAQHVFRANGLFDPSYTTTGHQPMNFDQWSQFYTHYTVLGSKCQMRYAPDALANRTNSSYFGIMLDSSTTGAAFFSNTNNLLESKLTRNYRICGENTSAGSGSLKPYPVVTKKFSAKKFFGVTNARDGNANSALTTADPANQAYFVCWAAAPGALDPDVVNFTVIIDYIVLFKYPKPIGGS